MEAKWQRFMQKYPELKFLDADNDEEDHAMEKGNCKERRGKTNATRGKREKKGKRKEKNLHKFDQFDLH